MVSSGLVSKNVPIYITKTEHGSRYCGLMAPEGLYFLMLVGLKQ